MEDEVKRTRKSSVVMIGALAAHVGQSTLFAFAAGLLTVAFRKNRAQVRYRLWFAASLKFFLLNSSSL